ncbi:MAG: GtrA family protein, partial [Sterolibacterium sp.]
MNNARRQFFQFAVIGGIGFAIDGGLLTLLSILWGMNVYVARLVSFLTATLSTWWLNRKHTFGMAPSGEFRAHANEYTRYFFIQVGGGLINLAVFVWLV